MKSIIIIILIAFSITGKAQETYHFNTLSSYFINIDGSVIKISTEVTVASAVFEDIYSKLTLDGDIHQFILEEITPEEIIGDVITKDIEELYAVVNREDKTLSLFLYDERLMLIYK